MNERQELIDLLIARETIKDANAYDRAESLADYLLENGYRRQSEPARACSWCGQLPRN